MTNYKNADVKITATDGTEFVFHINELPMDQLDARVNQFMSVHGKTEDWTKRTVIELDKVEGAN